MFKNSLKLIQNDFFNSFKFSIIVVFFFLFLKIIASYYYYFTNELDIFNLSNVFGGYIKSLYLDQEFKSCIEDNQFTIFKGDLVSCSYSTRMPVLPYLYFLFTFFSTEYFTIAILKNILLSLIFLLLLRIFYKKFILINQKTFYVINFLLLFIFISPSIIKHSSNISYEEGIILELLMLWSLFFLICVYFISKNLVLKNEYTPIVVITLSTVIYFTKASMLLCLILSIILSLFWLQKHQNYKIIITILISCSLVLSWGYRNLKTSNSYNIGSSINWVLGYYGLNNTALKIYPEIALDQIFFTESFKLKNNKIITNNDNVGVTFENEWVKNEYYKDKSLKWINENPTKFIKLSIKKFYNFFIYLKKTPYSVGPDVNLEYEKNSFQQFVVFIWLLFGRLSTLILMFMIFKKWKNEKFVCSFIILMCCAYAAPYLIGFNYERHITPVIVMTIFSNFMLFNISDSKYLYKKK